MVCRSSWIWAYLSRFVTQCTGQWAAGRRMGDVFSDIVTTKMCIACCRNASCVVELVGSHGLHAKFRSVRTIRTNLHQPFVTVKHTRRTTATELAKRLMRGAFVEQEQRW